MASILPEFQALYEAGKVLERDIHEDLGAWAREVEPSGLQVQEYFLFDDYEVPSEFLERTRGLLDRTYAWFNLVDRDLLPHVISDRQELNQLVSQITGAIKIEPAPSDSLFMSRKSTEKALPIVTNAMDQIIRLIFHSQG